jgi:hypothetical protein
MDDALRLAKFAKLVEIEGHNSADPPHLGSLYRSVAVSLFRLTKGAKIEKPSNLNSSATSPREYPNICR